MPRDRVSVGIEPARDDDAPDADAFVAGAIARAGADFAVLPIARPGRGAAAVRRGHFALDDLAVRSAESSYCVLGKLSPQPAALVEMELAYGAYVGLRGVVAPPIASGGDAADYARALCAQLPSQPVLVRVRLAAPGAWQQWNRLRLLCAHSPQLQVLLELDPGSAPGPDADPDADPLGQWRAEPVRVVVLPAQMFVANAGGYPVLRVRHQQAVARWMDFGAALAVLGGTADHVQYLRHLASARPERDPASAASDEYRDVLQAPLQPLMDHLDSVTYETFELDAPKYEHYEEAMARAIAAAAAAPRPQRVVLMVVGAGRGPLVGRALHAARRCDVDVDVVALEKNPSAMAELQRKNAALWGGAVTLVHADMRAWSPERRADILVSELLGSFGDNELSPECLDGALARLAAPGCVCIPHRYTAYVAPLSSTALFCRAREHSGQHGLETPYVVNIHAAAVLAAEQEAWSFRHGPPADNAESADGSAAPADHAAPADNQRSCAVSFAVRGPSLVHGIAGYFDAELYPGVELSTRPATHTPGMHSWFPMFFPIKQPLAVAAGDAVVVRMWRRTAGTRTWYEWCVETPRGPSEIHNISGRESWIGH
ncbi:hypothetical protein H4R18_000278 [Coemansia javaensis]|uniref:Protein arginine N-methyltransferase n=1 Tax=Coemansia javaensis TaxID=2761396 RepID=A0A9W8LME6_9FUNG|nr:hypothetical protein H4R18_000278 [Coemansia javaensis]